MTQIFSSHLHTIALFNTWTHNEQQSSKKHKASVTEKNNHFKNDHSTSQFTLHGDWVIWILQNNSVCKPHSYLGQSPAEPDSWLGTWSSRLEEAHCHCFQWPLSSTAYCLLPCFSRVSEASLILLFTTGHVHQGKLVTGYCSSLGQCLWPQSI